MCYGFEVWCAKKTHTRKLEGSPGQARHSHNILELIVSDAVDFEVMKVGLVVDRRCPLVEHDRGDDQGL